MLAGSANGGSARLARGISSDDSITRRPAIRNKEFTDHYAKQPCRISAFKPAGQSVATCEQEGTERYNTFELELETQFAALPECAGITVSSFGYPQNPKEPPPDTSQPYWSFSVNYTGDHPAQLWQMLPPKGSHLPMMQATGIPTQIATQVCNIIKGKGGAVVQ